VLKIYKYNFNKKGIQTERKLFLKCLLFKGSGKKGGGGITAAWTYRFYSYKMDKMDKTVMGI
jgi:hypothetical protein